MTEAEWLAATNPEPMLDHLKALGHGRNKAGQRRLRLFGCACCRRIWPGLSDLGLDAIRAAERAADGLLGKAELAALEEQTLHAGWLTRADTQRGRAAWACHNLVRAGDPPKRARAVSHLVAGYVAGADRHPLTGTGGPRDARLLAELRAHAEILRDLFGNPFVPPAPFRPTAEVVALARAANDERPTLSSELDPQRLGVLADALEDAGCRDDRLVSHLRSAGPHVRGCWAVGVALGSA